MTSDKKIAANRQNAKKSTGPVNTMSTRFNATKHGLLSAGVTELDDAEGYQLILDDLIREKNPVGVIESNRVRWMALDVVRLMRAHRLEGEFITAQLNPPTYESDSHDPLLAFQRRMVDPGIPATLTLDAVQHLVTVYQRLERFYANDLCRNERELERSQRLRRGEQLPAPAAIEVTVRADTQTIESRGAGPLDWSAIGTSRAGQEPPAGDPEPAGRSCDSLPRPASPIPRTEANRVCEGPDDAPVASPSPPSDSVDREQNSMSAALWHKARPKPIWRQ
jgi:hypothetical protein